MARHGYIDDCDFEDNLVHGRWRAQVRSATLGKRGQSFFRALVAALDAMPEKRLIEGELENQEGAVCALGALGKARGVDLSAIDTEDYEALGATFDIAHQLAQEVMYANDEAWVPSGGGVVVHITPEQRWEQVRRWAAKQIRLTNEELLRETP